MDVDSKAGAARTSVRDKYADLRGSCALAPKPDRCVEAPNAESASATAAWRVAGCIAGSTGLPHVRFSRVRSSFPLWSCSFAVRMLARFPSGPFLSAEFQLSQNGSRLSSTHWNERSAKSIGSSSHVQESQVAISNAASSRGALMVYATCYCPWTMPASVSPYTSLLASRNTYISLHISATMR